MHFRRSCYILSIFTLLRLASAKHTSSLEGRVVIPGSPAPPFTYQSCKVVLTSDSGRPFSAHVRADGSFHFPALPGDSYLLDIHAMAYIFPQFRVDVSSKRRDSVAVTLLSSSQQLMDQPLVILPMSPAKYYQERKPMDVYSFIASPYGIMIVLAVVALVVLPMMKVDPEEMKKLQDEMKDSPFSGFLGGATTSSNAAIAAPASSAGGSNKKKR